MHKYAVYSSKDTTHSVCMPVCHVQDFAGVSIGTPYIAETHKTPRHCAGNNLHNG